jgi:hypothetical protein
MITKNNTTTDKYIINNQTTVTVKNTLIEDKRTGEVYYHTDFSLKFKTTSDNKLTFEDHEGLKKFVQSLRIEDEQASLPLDMNGND